MSRMYEREIKTLSSLPYKWDRLNGKTILISGGTGLIGSLFLDVLRERNCKFGQYAFPAVRKTAMKR